MMELPTGTVTFLFTDIVGSTPLWEKEPEAMRRAVALHNTILWEAIHQNNGVTFKTIGDAFQAAFPLPNQAVQSAIDAQRVLQDADWPAQTGPIKVRMGIHTGPAEIETSPGGIDYSVSHTLNRVARIMSAGFGGQILLSQEAADLVVRELKPGVALKDLGEHHLKGLTRLEHLFQVCAPGLQDEFPPLASGLVSPNNLPSQLTSFIGREAELKEIQRLVTSGKARLLTLTGPGGTGKTRLALQSATNLLNTFPDGAWLVELAPLADPGLVPLTVAAALDIHETPGIDITQKLIEYLSPKHVLLILDNCEHLVEAAAMLCGRLLQACQHLQILATSREILGTMGETPFRVPSLALPSAVGMGMVELSRCESIRLFVERAQIVHPAFQLTETNAPVVARICQRLDGIPLAIELAAARARLLSVEQIAARLDDSFRLLTGGSRTVLSRHQTLRALIDWSYNLLSPQERMLFLRLSVFAGGCTLEAAENVCADPLKLESQSYSIDENTATARLPGAANNDEMVNLEPESILDLLTQLVDKSLVIPVDIVVGSSTPEIGTETRYRLLETIRQYARDRLHDMGGGGVVRDRHLAYFLLLAEEAEPHLRRGDQVAWLDRLDMELDNLRLALEWSLAGRVDEGLRLAASLLWFWHIRGHAHEGVEWLMRLQETGAWEDGETVSAYRQMIRARALIAAGFMAHFQSKFEQGVHLLEQAVEILRGLGPAGRRWLGVALLFLSKPQRDHTQRVRLMEEALPLLREMGDPLYLAEYQLDLGSLLIEENKIDQATTAFMESMSLRSESNDLDGLGTASLSLGDMALFRRDYAECKRYYEKSLAWYQKVKNKIMESLLLSRLGNIDLLTGNFDQAANRFEAGKALNQQMGDRLGMINSLFDLGRLDLNIGQYRQASWRFAEAAGIGAEIHSNQAVLAGLLFQGLAAKGTGDLEQVDHFAIKSVEAWREVGHGEFNPSFIAGNLENLAVLLVDHHPDLAVRLFSAVDHLGLVNHEFNTTIEMAFYEGARLVARQALGEDQYNNAVEEGSRLNLDDTLALVFSGELFTAK